MFFAATALLRRDLISCVGAGINGKELLDHFIQQLLSAEHVQVQVLFVGFGSYCIPFCKTLCFACPLRKEVQCRDLSANPYKKLVAVIWHAVWLWSLTRQFLGVLAVHVIGHADALISLSWIMNEKMYLLNHKSHCRQFSKERLYAWWSCRLAKQLMDHVLSDVMG